MATAWDGSPRGSANRLREAVRGMDGAMAARFSGRRSLFKEDDMNNLESLYVEELKYAYSA